MRPLQATPHVHTLTQAVFALNPRRVLIIGREPRLRAAVARVLRLEGYEVAMVDHLGVLDEVERSISHEGWHRAFDAIVIDVHDAEPIDADLLEGLRKVDWSTPVVALVARADDPEVRMTVERLGVQAALAVPFDPESLAATLLAVAPPV